MKSISFIFLFLLSTCLFSQTPQGINYQGVARNTMGVALANQNIGIELSIHNTSASGPVVYTETFNTTTDANGLFTLVIGSGTPTVGTFTGIDWSAGTGKWLEVSMDASGGTSYLSVGTSQLMSVPYALYAGKVANNGGKSILILSDSITDSEAATIIANEVGKNTNQIVITDCVNLTTLDLSSVTDLLSIQVVNCPALTTLNLNGVKRMFGDIYVKDCSQLAAVSLPLLTRLNNGSIKILNTGVTNISAPLLENFSGNIEITDNGSLTSISLPSITQANNIQIANSAALTNVDLSSLFTTVSLNLYNCASLTSASFPALAAATNGFSVSYTGITTLSLASLANVQGFSVTQNPLTTINVPSLNYLAGSIVITINSLPVSTIDNFLYLAANTNTMNPGAVQVFFSQGQTPPAPPSTTGQSYVSMLQSQGVWVQTD